MNRLYILLFVLICRFHTVSFLDISWRRGVLCISRQLGDRALSLAAGTDNVECVRLLLEYGADKNAADNVRGVASHISGSCTIRVSMYMCAIRFVNIFACVSLIIFAWSGIKCISVLRFCAIEISLNLQNSYLYFSFLNLRLFYFHMSRISNIL